MDFAHDVTHAAAVQLNSRIQTIEAAPGVFAFRRELSIAAGEGQQAFANSDVWPAHRVDHGFVDADNLELLLSHRPFQKRPLAVISEEEKAALVREGYYGVDFVHAASGRVALEWLAKGDVPLCVVRIDDEQCQVYDLADQPLAQAVSMDYIESRISERSHDLARVAAHLLGRNDVRVCHKDHEWMTETATSVEEAIVPIEVDDREFWGSQSVQFVWTPSEEDYRKVWFAEPDRPGWSFRASELPRRLMALDLLGLDQFKVNAAA
jgi:hypothetical protein